MTEYTLPLRVASGFIARARGLLFSTPLPAGTALALPRTSAVHGLLMNRPLDLAFLSAEGRVLAVSTLPPGRLRWHRGAQTVLEFEAGQVAALGIRPGDRIRPAEPPRRLADRAGRATATKAAALKAATLKAAAMKATVTKATVTKAAVRTVLCAAALAGTVPGGQVWASTDRGDHGQGRQASTAAAFSGTASSVGSGGSVGAVGAVDPAASAAARLPAAWITRFADRAEALYQSGADDEALAAFATWLDADPGAEAVVILRIGNLHQRKGRDWLAIDSYRRALDLAPTGDPIAVEARRKALVNLDGLLEVVAQRVADGLAPAARPGATPLPGNGLRSGPRAAPLAREASPAREAPSAREAPTAGEMPRAREAPSARWSAPLPRPVVAPERPVRPLRTGQAPGAAGTAPTVEYLGHR